MKNLLIFSCLVFLFSCGNNTSGSAEHQEDFSQEISLPAGRYLVLDLNGKDVSSEGIILQFDTAKMELTGDAGCNPLRADYHQKKESIIFDDPISTKMFCEGKMENEESLIAILGEISGFQKDAEKLIFLSEEGKPLLIAKKTA